MASSCLRVSTPCAGYGKGQLFTPEVGSQVLVGYAHGPAGFPVVLGNLFHARNSQRAKYSFPQNNLKGLQMAGGNKFVMSEVAGAQTMLLSNPPYTDLNTALTGRCYTRVLGYFLVPSTRAFRLRYGIRRSARSWANRSKNDSSLRWYTWKPAWRLFEVSVITSMGRPKSRSVCQAEARRPRSVSTSP